MPSRALLSLAPLLAAVALLQVSTGGLGPLDALSGVALGFTAAEVGLLGSAHFAGFLLGCWATPRLLGHVGHARAFAALSAAGVMGMLAHVLTEEPLAWALFRVASGLCVAGCYTVIEAWLQARVTNATRGRAMGAYRSVDMGAALGAQALIAVLAPAAYASYVTLALLGCAALLPLTLTRAEQPPVPAAPRLRPLLAAAKSPLAAASVMVAGLTTAAFRMVGPLYGEGVGLGAGGIALFLSAFFAGGFAAQWPMGWLADRMDRRHLLIALSGASVGACALCAGLAALGPAGAAAGGALVGLATFPIYSVAAAHAHDFADDSERVELSAALMFLFALGAIASPLAASALIGAVGPGAMFAMLGGAHGLLAAVGLLRLRARPTPEARVPYAWVPRTSFTIGRLLARRRR